MSRLHLHPADSSARLERLLMRWPTSPRLRIALAEARNREDALRKQAERQARQARQQLIQAIRNKLTSADADTLQRLAEVLEAS